MIEMAAHTRKSASVKARIIGGRRSIREIEAILANDEETIRKSAEASNILSTDNRAEPRFSDAQILEPPLIPEDLVVLFENSGSLRQNVDAYVTNIDSFGHRFEETLDVEADDAGEKIAAAIFVERLHELERGEEELPEDDESLTPSEEDVEKRKAEIARDARRQRVKAEAFFASCCVDESFVSLRRRTRQDKEITGNAYWEVSRDQRGRICALQLIPSFTMGLRPLDRKVTKTTRPIRVSDLQITTVATLKRFRRFVQKIGTRSVHFKEFGDPRIISAKTGKVFRSIGQMQSKERHKREATEVIHFSIFSSRSAYGLPRWSGALLCVLGAREAEEINQSYFENKSVPPMVILVSGGRLSEDSTTSLENFINEEIKGKGNFHKIAILEADNDASEHSALPKIEIKPLMGAQLQDALFQKYDERCVDKVGMTFRLPRLLRGDSRDFNRATARAALEFAEAQVFEPERNDFDWVINTKILPELGITLWRFRSNGPVKRDPMEVSDKVQGLVEKGVLTPEEGRMFIADAFGRELARIDADWVKQPIKLTLAGIPVEKPEDDPAATGGTQEGDEEARNGKPDEDLDKAMKIVKILRNKKLAQAVEEELEAALLAVEKLDEVTVNVDVIDD